RKAGRRMALSAGDHAARTPGASRALTPSTTHGGHPASRGARVPTTVRCQPPGRSLSRLARPRVRVKTDISECREAHVPRDRRGFAGAIYEVAELARDQLGVR